MSGVLVDYSPKEAAAVLAKLTPVDGEDWIDSDPDFITGTRKLEQALKVELGASGNADEGDVVQRARELVGQDVVIRRAARRSTVKGHLQEVRESTTLVLIEPEYSLRKLVPTVSVDDIEPAGQMERAA